MHEHPHHEVVHNESVSQGDTISATYCNFLRGLMENAWQKQPQLWHVLLLSCDSSQCNENAEVFCPYNFCSPPAVVTRFDFLHHLKLKKELEDYLLDTKRHQTTEPLGGSSVDMLKAAMTLNARSPIFKSGKCSGAKLYGSNS